MFKILSILGLVFIFYKMTIGSNRIEESTSNTDEEFTDYEEVD